MTRSRRIALVSAAVGGLLTGIVVTLAATSPTEPAASTPTPDPAVTSQPTPSAASTTAPAHVAEEDSTTLLVWTSGGLPAGFAEQVARLGAVRDETMVAGDQVDLLRSARSDGTIVDAPADGWAIPLDTLAIDPKSFAAFVPEAERTAIEALRTGGALLTRSSLALRHLDIGSTIELRGGAVRVTGMVEDLTGAGSELIVPAADAPRLGVETPRYILLHHAVGQRPLVTDAIAGLAGTASIRFRSPAETTWLRHGDAVTPQLFVKQTYGEFAYRDRSGRDVEIDPGWVAAKIVDADVPLLGHVRCHRLAIGPLTTALTALADENLGHLVDTDAFAGCWSPRRIDAQQPLSRHAWGVAIDLNITDNPRGSFSSQDPRLVEAMRDAGFTWGGLWLVPDPGHYELVPG